MMLLGAPVTRGKAGRSHPCMHATRDSETPCMCEEGLHGSERRRGVKGAHGGERAYSSKVAHRGKAQVPQRGA